MRTSILTLPVCLAAFLQTAWAQTPAKLEFEVASIKPAPPFNPQMMASGKMRLGMNVDGARVDIAGMPIMALLPQVFRVKQYQISGATPGPEFMMMERWDIVAKIPDGAKPEQVPDMLLSLLQDRFKLTFHRETKQLPVYALIAGKGGLKMQDTSAEAEKPFPEGPDTITQNGPNGPMRMNAPGGGRGGPGFGPGPGRGGGTMTMNSPEFGTMKMIMSDDGGMHLEAEKMTMHGFAEFLSNMVDRPVLDLTELKGTYKLSLEMSMQDMMAGRGGGGRGFGGPGGPPQGGGSNMPSASDPSGGGIFAAIQKLGLKLDSRKAPIDTVVIDHLEKTPTEN